MDGPLESLLSYVYFIARSCFLLLPVRASLLRSSTRVELLGSGHQVAADPSAPQVHAHQRGCLRADALAVAEPGAALQQPAQPPIGVRVGAFVARASGMTESQ